MLHLRGLTQLEVLYLNDTKVGDAGIASLAGMMRLKKLQLDRTEITDYGLLMLSNLGGLEEIDLLGTKVTDGGQEAFHQAVANAMIVRQRDGWKAYHDQFDARRDP